jgi:hypothetical protein
VVIGNPNDKIKSIGLGLNFMGPLPFNLPLTFGVAMGFKIIV